MGGGDMMGEQTAKVALGWILKASWAVLRSLDHEGWVCWPCGGCQAACAPIITFT